VSHDRDGQVFQRVSVHDAATEMLTNSGLKQADVLKAGLTVALCGSRAELLRQT